MSCGSCIIGIFTVNYGNVNVAAYHMRTLINRGLMHMTASAEHECYLLEISIALCIQYL